MIVLGRRDRKQINQGDLTSWSARGKECANNFVTNSCSHGVCGEDSLPLLALPVSREMKTKARRLGKTTVLESLDSVL